MPIESLIQPDVLVEAVVLPLEHGNVLDHWANAEFHLAVDSRIKAVMGLAAFMMLVCVPTFLALHYWSKNYAVPTVVLVLSGGLIIGMVPSPVARIGYLIIFISGALGLFGLLWAVIK